VIRHNEIRYDHYYVAWDSQLVACAVVLTITMLWLFSMQDGDAW